MKWTKEHGNHSKNVTNSFFGKHKAENYHAVVADLV